MKPVKFLKKLHSKRPTFHTIGAKDFELSNNFLGSIVNTLEGCIFFRAHGLFLCYGSCPDPTEYSQSLVHSVGNLALVYFSGPWENILTIWQYLKI